MGKIYLNDMSFYAHHGCYEEERIVGTNFKVNLEVHYDSSVSEKSDNIKDAVNYLELYNLVKKEIMVPSHILENVARRILDAIYTKYANITYCRVGISKLAPPLGGDIKNVMVEIEL